MTRHQLVRARERCRLLAQAEVVRMKKAKPGSMERAEHKRKADAALREMQMLDRRIKLRDSMSSEVA